MHTLTLSPVPALFTRAPFSRAVLTCPYFSFTSLLLLCFFSCLYSRICTALLFFLCISTVLLRAHLGRSSAATVVAVVHRHAARAARVRDSFFFSLSVCLFLALSFLRARARACRCGRMRVRGSFFSSAEPRARGCTRGYVYVCVRARTVLVCVIECPGGVRARAPATVACHRPSPSHCKAAAMPVAAPEQAVCARARSPMESTRLSSFLFCFVSGRRLHKSKQPESTGRKATTQLSLSSLELRQERQRRRCPRRLVIIIFLRLTSTNTL